jgi:hypothetical protein
MVRHRRNLLTVFTAIAIIAAGCIGIDSSAPEPLFAPGSAAADLSGLLNAGADTSVTVFVVDPTVTSAYPIGAVHRLWIQAGGICALGSAYGVDLWDTPCEIATSPIVITAKTWYDADRHPHIDFWPQLRFAPLDGKRAAAELYMKDKTASLDPKAVILYCHEGACIDESIHDSSLVTLRDRQQGFVYRRIKHFSGYEVVAGRGDSTADSSGVP